MNVGAMFSRYGFVVQQSSQSQRLTTGYEYLAQGVCVTYCTVTNPLFPNLNVLFVLVVLTENHMN